MSTIQFSLVEISIVVINNSILTSVFIVDIYNCSYITDIINGIQFWLVKMKLLEL